MEMTPFRYIQQQWRVVGRQLFWFRAGRHLIEYDFSSVYAVMGIQLARIDEYLHSDRSIVRHGKRSLRALKEARELCRRLQGQTYDMEDPPFISRPAEQWAEGERTELGVVTRISPAYGKYLRIYGKHSEMLYAQYKNRFYYLLQTFLEKWWD